MVCDICKLGPEHNGTGSLCSDDCTNFGGFLAIEGVKKLCSNCGRIWLKDGICIRTDSCNKYEKAHWIPDIF